MTWNHTDHHSGAFNGSAFNRTGDHKNGDHHNNFSLPTGIAGAPHGLPSALPFQNIHKRDVNSTEGSSKRHNPNDSLEEHDHKDSAEKKSETEKSPKAKKADKEKKNKPAIPASNVVA